MIDEDGKQVGIFSLDDALKIAKERDLDLVQVSVDIEPVVCKLLDYNKYKYQQKKKRQQQQKSKSLKEIRFNLFIDEHDYKIKLQNIRRLLQKGNKVYLRLLLRRRELNQESLTTRLFERICEDTADIAKVQQKLKQVGMQFIMLLTPK